MNIIENCPNDKDCRDGLGRGPGIGEFVPEMALGLQMAEFDPYRLSGPRPQKLLFRICIKSLLFAILLALVDIEGSAACAIFYTSRGPEGLGGFDVFIRISH